jgi:hypothetical protein
MSKKKEREEQRKARTIKLELPEDIKQELIDLASELEVPTSQVAAILLDHGFEAIQNGEIDLSEYLQPSRSPLFRYTLNIDKYKEDKKKKKSK